MKISIMIVESLFRNNQIFITNIIKCCSINDDDINPYSRGTDYPTRITHSTHRIDCLQYKYDLNRNVLIAQINQNDRLNTEKQSTI